MIILTEHQVPTNRCLCQIYMYVCMYVCIYIHIVGYLPWPIHIYGKIAAFQNNSANGLRGIKYLKKSIDSHRKISKKGKRNRNKVDHEI